MGGFIEKYREEGRTGERSYRGEGGNRRVGEFTKR